MTHRAKGDATQELHVKQPLGTEWLGEDALCEVSAEYLGAALRVVHWGVKEMPDQGLHQCRGGVAEERTVDLRTEMRPPGTENRLCVGMAFQLVVECLEFGERGGEIGVPEADPVRLRTGEQRLDPGMYGGGLADIAWKVYGLYGRGLPGEEGQGFRSVIRRAVVDEQQRQPRECPDGIQECGDVQPPVFVFAGDHKRYGHLDTSFHRLFSRMNSLSPGCGERWSWEPK